MIFGGDYCAWCGQFNDSENLRQIERWVESARSGGSTTYRGSHYGLNFGGKKGGRTGGGVSYNTGRTYYRKVKELVCIDCLRAEAEAQRRREQRAATILKYMMLSIFTFFILIWVFG